MTRLRWTRLPLATLIVATLMPLVGTHAAADTFEEWSVTLTASDTRPWPGENMSLTATANRDIEPYGYFISIYEQSSGTLLNACSQGTTCGVSTTFTKGASLRYLAFISADQPTDGYPGYPLAQSADLTVDWREVHVQLSPFPATAHPGSTTTLYATATEARSPEPVDLRTSPYVIQIYDVVLGQRLVACKENPCTASVRQTEEGTRRYAAYVASAHIAYPPSRIQAVSTYAYVTWDNHQWALALDVPPVVESNPVRITATTGREVDEESLYLEIFDNYTQQLIVRCDIGLTCEVDWHIKPDRPGPWRNYVAFVTGYHSTPMPDRPVASSPVMYTFASS